MKLLGNVLKNRKSMLYIFVKSEGTSLTFFRNMCNAVLSTSYKVADTNELSVHFGWGYSSKPPDLLAFYPI